MAEKRPLMPKLLVVVAVLIAIVYGIVRVDVWYTERNARSDLHEPPQPGVEAQP